MVGITCLNLFTQEIILLKSNMQGGFEMRKFSVLTIALVLIIALAACRRGNNNETTPSTAPSTRPTTATQAPTTRPSTAPTILPTIDPTLDTNIPDPSVDTSMPDMTDGRSRQNMGGF